MRCMKTTALARIRLVGQIHMLRGVERGQSRTEEQVEIGNVQGPGSIDRQGVMPKLASMVTSRGQKQLSRAYDTRSKGVISRGPWGGGIGQVMLHRRLEEEAGKGEEDSRG